jgi:hydrogenase maturation protease
LSDPNKKNSILIIGVGNLFRGDDAVGILVARKIEKLNLDKVCVTELSGEGTSLMEAWSCYERVIIADAVSSGESPGSIKRLDVSKNSIPANYFSCSSHNFGVAEGIEMARTLDQLPKHVELFGIEGKNFQPGESLSPEMDKAIESTVQEITQSISSTP